MDEFLNKWQQYIMKIVDVKSDGNYGYRTIVPLLGQGEESWSLIRQDLIRNSNITLSLYSIILLKRKTIGINNPLYVECDQVLDAKWMTILDMRYVIASRYNVVLVHLSRLQSWTFFPFFKSPSAAVSCLIAIRFVNWNHFVQVYIIY